jgi:hypothetical protein
VYDGGALYDGAAAEDPNLHDMNPDLPPASTQPI